jgi:hypothetical protein
MSLSKSLDNANRPATMSNMNNNDIIYRLRNHTPAICSTLIEDAIKHIWDLEDQRDQARMEYCIAESENDAYNEVMSSPATIAEECGWGYLKERFDGQGD